MDTLTLTPTPMPKRCHIVVNSGNLRALVDMQVGEFLISGVRIVAEPHKKAWASLPQRQSSDGRWFPVLSCTNKVLERSILDEALRYWREQVGAPQG